jgi:hypothetical protein
MLGAAGKTRPAKAQCAASVQAQHDQGRRRGAAGGQALTCTASAASASTSRLTSRAPGAAGLRDDMPAGVEGGATTGG